MLFLLTCLIEVLLPLRSAIQSHLLPYAWWTHATASTFSSDQMICCRHRLKTTMVLLARDALKMTFFFAILTLDNF